MPTPPYPNFSEEKERIIDASDYSLRSHRVNAKACKAILLMIEEEADKGNYSLSVNRELLPENKKVYLEYLGFRIGWNGDKPHIMW